MCSFLLSLALLIREGDVAKEGLGTVSNDTYFGDIGKEEVVKPRARKMLYMTADRVCDVIKNLPDHLEKR